MSFLSKIEHKNSLIKTESFYDVGCRWDINAVNKLPEYMRLFYKFFLSVYSEMEEELAKSGNSDRVNYAKQEV